MDRIYSRWMEAGRLSSEDGLRLEAMAAMMLGIYREHIRIEEEIVFPCAARLIAGKELAAIGAEFKARREHGG